MVSAEFDDRRRGTGGMTMRVGVDIGGTFTDFVAFGADGSVRTFKTPSTPADPSIAIIDGIAALLNAGGAGASLAEVLHATTIGSNAILQGQIARTALVTTRGFRDVLEIRDLRMPRLYDIGWTKPVPLVPRHLRLEVDEKTRPDGSIGLELEASSVAAVIKTLREQEVQSVAICLLHSYANPAHEKVVAEAIRAALPQIAVSVSHEILPEIKEYPRTSTTVINAAIQPVMRAYLTTLQARLQSIGVAAPLRMMQSNGGLVAAQMASDMPARLVESGPAAGVVGAAVLAARLGEASVVTFDMGGTTAKAGLVEDGQVARSEAMEVGAGVMAGARLLVGGGYMLKLPSIDLAEVGAGGGSICRIDAAGAPKVGPQSAGAVPGPVAYGKGGTEPTITDCAWVLGHLDPAGLAGGSLRLDLELARRAVQSKLAEPLGLSLEQAAQGMLRIAAATMMRAIRAVSVERGRDVRSCALMAFGGNGPLFAAAIARELGITRVIVPPMPGLFSAFGLLLADTEHHLTRTLRAQVGEISADAFRTELEALLDRGEALLEADGFPAERREAFLSVMARYVGQSSEIAVPLVPGTAAEILAGLPEAFGVEHARSYGFRGPEDEKVELMGLQLLARGRSETPRLPGRIPPASLGISTLRPAWFEGTGWVATEVIDRAALTETPRQGPLIVQEYDATCLIPPGAQAALDGFGNIRITV